jgi:hypothetical protein
MAWWHLVGWWAMVGKLYLWHGNAFWGCLYGDFAVNVAFDLGEWER